MDEHEVELIDYLRVLWWGKWIILACFVVAVGLSVLYTVTRPTTYSGSVELSVREYVTAALSGRASAAGTVSAAIEAALAGVKSEVPGIATQYAGGRIVLSRNGAPSSEAVSTTLTRAEEALSRALGPALAEEFGHLAIETRLRIDGLEAQRDLLAPSDAPLAISEALASEMARLERDIAGERVVLRTLETVNPESLLVVTVTTPLEPKASRAGSRTTIAVAGFLGLMLGTLLAFFAHYLRQVRLKERGAGA